MKHCSVGVCSSPVHCAEIGHCFSAPERSTAPSGQGPELPDVGPCLNCGGKRIAGHCPSMHDERGFYVMCGECRHWTHRAALASQPSTAPKIPFAGFDPKFCPGSNPENPQEFPEQQSSTAPAASDGQANLC